MHAAKEKRPESGQIIFTLHDYSALEGEQLTEKLSSYPDKDYLLRQAVMYGYDELIDPLIAAGVDINKDISSFRKALDCAAFPLDLVSFAPVFVGIRTTEQIQAGRLRCVQKLLERGYKPWEINSQGWSALHNVAELGNPEVMKILLEQPDSPEKQKAVCSIVDSVMHPVTKLSAAGVSLFGIAVFVGAVNCARLLLEKYAKDKKDAIKKLANEPNLLHLAIMSGVPDMVKLLLEFDARPDTLDIGTGKGFTLLHVAIISHLSPPMISVIVQGFPKMASAIYPADRKRPIDYAPPEYLEQLRIIPGLLESLGYQAPNAKAGSLPEAPALADLLTVIQKQDEANLEAAVRRASPLERKEGAMKAAELGWLPALKTLYRIWNRIDLREGKDCPLTIAKDKRHAAIVAWLLQLKQEKESLASLSVFESAPQATAAPVETYYQTKQREHIKHLNASLVDWRKEADACKKQIEPHSDGRSGQLKFSEEEREARKPEALSREIKTLLEQIDVLEKSFKRAKIELSFSVAAIKEQLSKYLKLLQNPVFASGRSRSSSGSSIVRDRSLSRGSEEIIRGGASGASSSAEMLPPPRLAGSASPALGGAAARPPLASPPRLALAVGAASGIAFVRPRADLLVTDQFMASLRQALERLAEAFSKPDSPQTRAVLWLNQVRLFRLLAEVSGKGDSSGFSEYYQADRVGNHLVHQHAGILFGDKIFNAAHELVQIKTHAGGSNQRILSNLNDWLARKRYFEITNSDPGPEGLINSNDYYKDVRPVAELLASLKAWVLPAFALFEKEVGRTGSTAAAASNIDVFEYCQAAILIWRELVQRSYHSQDLCERLGEWAADFWKEIGGFSRLIAHDHETAEPLSAEESAMIGVDVITRDAVHPQAIWEVLRAYLPKLKALSPEIFERPAIAGARQEEACP